MLILEAVDKKHASRRDWWPTYHEVVMQVIQPVSHNLPSGTETRMNAIRVVGRGIVILAR